MKNTEWIGSAISITLFALLAIASWTLSEFLQRSFSQAGRPASGPNTIIENAEIIRTNSLGQPILRLQTLKIISSDAQDSAQFDMPRLTSLSADRPLTTVSAARAIAKDNQNRIDLSGDVLISRAAFAGQPPVTVKTSHVTLLVKEERATTDAPVWMQRGQSTLQGVGMELDQKTQRIDIISGSRMVIPKGN
jgi:lipopolysaccharide export system protein LptC